MNSGRQSLASGGGKHGEGPSKRRQQAPERNLIGAGQPTVEQPEDLLLNLRKPFKADFDSEVAACHHDPNRWSFQAGEQKPRQILKGAPILNL